MFRLCQIGRRGITPFDTDFQRDDTGQRKISSEFKHRVHRLKIVGRAEDKAMAANMDRGDSVGRRHLHYSEQPVISRQQRRRALDQYVQRLDPRCAVRMSQPFRPAHKFGSQMRAQEAVEAWRLLTRQRDQS